MREASRRHEADADRAVDDLVESRSEITRLEEEVPRLAGRYRVFQQLRGYFTDLVDCFDEKVTSVFSIGFFACYFLKVLRLHHFSKIKSHKEVTKQ